MASILGGRLVPIRLYGKNFSNNGDYQALTIENDKLTTVSSTFFWCIPNLSANDSFHKDLVETWINQKLDLQVGQKFREIIREVCPISNDRITRSDLTRIENHANNTIKLACAMKQAIKQNAMFFQQKKSMQTCVAFTENEYEEFCIKRQCLNSGDINCKIVKDDGEKEDWNGNCLKQNLLQMQFQEGVIDEDIEDVCYWVMLKIIERFPSRDNLKPTPSITASEMRTWIAEGALKMGIYFLPTQFFTSFSADSKLCHRLSQLVSHRLVKPKILKQAIDYKYPWYISCQNMV